jgi:hypothetical protein
MYTTKHIINSSDLLNDQVLLFFDQHDISAVQVLTYRSTELFGRAYAHDCELFLALKQPRSLPHQGKESPDQRNLRTVPENGAR